MASDIFNLHDVISVKEVIRGDDADRHLKLGWILLGVGGTTLKYSLGWPKQNGEICHPAKTIEEIEMEEFSKVTDIPY